MADIPTDAHVSYEEQEADEIRERILNADQPPTPAKPSPAAAEDPTVAAARQAELDESTARYFEPLVFEQRDLAFEELGRRDTLNAALQTLYQAEDTSEIEAAASWVADDPVSRQQFLEEWQTIDPDGAREWAAMLLAEKQAEHAWAVEEREQDARAAAQQLADQQNREIVETIVDFAKRRPEVANNPDRVARLEAVAASIPFSDSLSFQEKLDASARIADELQLAEETEAFQNRILSVNRVDARPAPTVPPVTPNFDRLLTPQETVADLKQSMTSLSPMQAAMRGVHAAFEAKQAEAADAKEQERRAYLIREYERCVGSGQVHQWRNPRNRPAWFKG